MSEPRSNNRPEVSNQSPADTPPQVPPSLTRPLPAILVGGLVAGALDITYACVSNRLRFGSPASRTLQSVSSGLLGRAALQGGVKTAVLGLILHFFIALSWATIYYVASRRSKVLLNRTWVGGVLFGALVYVVMSAVVVPLSAAPFHIPMGIVGLMVHMFFVGLPIALAVRRYSHG